MDFMWHQKLRSLCLRDWNLKSIQGVDKNGFLCLSRYISVIDLYDFSGCAVSVSPPSTPPPKDGASPASKITLNLWHSELPQDYLTL